MISTASAHLAPKEHCTGCSACASGCPRGAIKMVADRESVGEGKSVNLGGRRIVKKKQT